MHTKGKLIVKDKWIQTESGHEVAYFGLPDMDEEDARRLVACWNEHDDLVKERDELVSVLRELAHGEYSDEIGNRAIAILAKYPQP